MTIRLLPYRNRSPPGAPAVNREYTNRSVWMDKQSAIIMKRIIKRLEKIIQSEQAQTQCVSKT